MQIVSLLTLRIDPERGMIWERELKRYLPGYVQVQSHQLVGLLMCLFVKEELVDCVRDVQYEVTKVGKPKWLCIYGLYTELGCRLGLEEWQETKVALPYTWFSTIAACVL